MTNITLTLGGITFSGFEIPESMPFGGEHHVTKHQLVGGARQVDAMGADQQDFEWSGQFRGSSAVTRARSLDRMRIAGLPVTLAWDQFTYQVIITSFRPVYTRGGLEIPYRIVCMPTVGEMATPAATQGIDGLLSGDMLGLGSLISSISGAVSGVVSSITGPLAGITGFLGDATQSIAALGSLAGVSAGVTGGIVTKLANVQTGLNGLIAVGDGNILTGAGQIGGVLPTSPTGGLTGITSQIASLQTLSDLVTARGTAGRAINNIKQAGSSL